MRRKLFKAALPGFLGGSEGGITIWSLYCFMIVLGFAGLSLDINNIVRARTQLQGAADAAGHAALYARYVTGEDAAGKSAGIAVAQANMPTSLFGDVLITADIEYGDWNKNTWVFTPGSGSSAVRVTTRRIDGRSNSVGTFLLNFMGIDTLQLNTTSIWEYEELACDPGEGQEIPGEGFFAVGTVDMQTANTYTDYFCIHSQTYVKLSNHNHFDPTVSISMPDQNDIQVPVAGWESNTNLADVLHSYDYDFLETFTQGTGNGTLSKMIDDAMLGIGYNGTNDVHIAGGDMLTDAHLAGGGVMNVVTCAGQSFSVQQNEVISGKNIATACKISFLAGSVIEDGVLAQDNTANNAITGPNGTRWGRTDYCDDAVDADDDVTIMTKGTIHIAADFEAYGVEMLAMGDVGIAAKADGLAGVNLVAGGDVDVTTASDFGFCGKVPDDVTVPAFRMVL